MSGNFIVTTETTLSSTLETPVLYIVNPTGNTDHLSGIRLTGASLENSANMTFRIYVDPVVSSNGTSLSIASKNFISTNSSLMNAYLTPTITSKGAKISVFSVVTSESYSPDTIDWYLAHGHSFLITAQTNTSSKGLALTMTWSE